MQTPSARAFGPCFWPNLVFLFVLCSILPACSLPPVCKADQSAAPSPALPQGNAGFLPYAHSHNDYEQPKPLETALNQRFYSVEADIYHSAGEITVSHFSWGTKGTLKDLYLDPLQARVDAQGSVHGDGLPFTLWIDLKDGDTETVNTLYGLLESYSMFASYSVNSSIPGPVIAVLTGDADGKNDFVTAFSPRKATRDSNDYSPEDPPATPAWQYYALSWTDYLDSSTGKLSADDEERLGCIMENAHANGRRVRFFSAPDNADYWQTALDFGIDFINTDQPAKLNEFLTNAFSASPKNK